MATTEAESARARVAELDWWHTIEVAPGVVTPGGWDLRPTAKRLPWPSSLAGMRCLDIGTMDGFWAFELDRFTADRLRGQQHRRPSERNFALAAELRGSRIALRDLNVYELDPDEIGEFDLLVMGYVLEMLRDPLRGPEAVRRVCRGQLILLDTVSRPLELLHAPLARLDARCDGSEWFVFNRRGLGAGVGVDCVIGRNPRTALSRQGDVYVVRGSVALLVDLVHDFGDAATARADHRPAPRTATAGSPPARRPARGAPRSCCGRQILGLAPERLRREGLTGRARLPGEGLADPLIEGQGGEGFGHRGRCVLRVDHHTELT
jgi:tRNA (mo5U34)-methyltransferase